MWRHRMVVCQPLNYRCHTQPDEPISIKELWYIVICVACQRNDLWNIKLPFDTNISLAAATTQNRCHSHQPDSRHQQRAQNDRHVYASHYNKQNIQSDKFGKWNCDCEKWSISLRPSAAYSKLTTVGSDNGLSPGPRFNIEMSSYQYRKFHCGDKTVVRSSYIHNGFSYTGKMTS